MTTKRKNISTIKQYFRLIGKSVKEPSRLTDLELAEFVVANRKLLIGAIISQPMTGGLSIELTKSLQRNGLADKNGMLK